MPIKNDDEEIEYGREYVHELTDGLDDDPTLTPLKGNGEIWPHWNNGVPVKLRRMLGSPPFSLKGVEYKYRTYFESLEFNWNTQRRLAFLRDHYNYLPSIRRSFEWSGVYRVFSPDTTIRRVCDDDPTGTLYLGRAGGVGRNWSILRTRIMAIVKREHHATLNWSNDTPLRNKFPWESLSIEWAFTGERRDYKGDLIAAAPLAETWLLRCYNDSYGELPPLNQKG